MPADKPRILQNNRDMAISLIPIVAIILLVAGLAGQCSVSTDGPNEGEIPDYDPAESLGNAARTFDIPLRDPQIPSDWTPNSGGTVSVPGNEGGTGVRVGYITDGGDYVEFMQSNAAPDALAGQMAGETRQATGTEDVDGTTWDVYEREDAEPVWVTDADDVRWGITGRPGHDNFRVLAEAAESAPVITIEDGENSEDGEGSEGSGAPGDRDPRSWADTGN